MALLTANLAVWIKVRVLTPKEIAILTIRTMFCVEGRAGLTPGLVTFGTDTVPCGGGIASKHSPSVLLMAKALTLGGGTVRNLQVAVGLAPGVGDGVLLGDADWASNLGTGAVRAGAVGVRGMITVDMAPVISSVSTLFCADSRDGRFASAVASAAASGATGASIARASIVTT